MYVTEYDQKTLYKSIFVLFIHYPCIYLFLRSSVLAGIFVIFLRGGGAPMASPSLKKKTFLSKWGRLPQFEEYMFSVVDSIQK